MSSKIIDGIVKDLKSIPKKAAGSFKGDPKKLILMSLPYMFAGYFADKASYVYRMASGNDMSSKMASVIAGLDKMFADPLPSFNSIDLIIGVAGGAVLRFIVYNKSKNAKKYRHGREYGSARWSA